MARVTVRADAFHCQLAGGGRPGMRSPSWFVPGDGECGTQSVFWVCQRLYNMISISPIEVGNIQVVRHMLAFAGGGYQSSVIRLGRAWTCQPGRSVHHVQRHVVAMFPTVRSKPLPKRSNH